MNKATRDSVWQTVRYFLIAVGGFLAGQGKLDPNQVVPLADSIIQLGGIALTVGTALWGIWVKWRTVPVLETVVVRHQVPMVDSATGETVAPKK